MRKLAVIAVGGNALIRDKERVSIPDQYEVARTVAERVADIVEQGWNVVLTHGNGPQVGFVMRRSELADGQVAPVALDYAGADVQGAVGYMFCKALSNVFRRRGLPGEPIALVAQALVDRDDPAFARPGKPIGSWFDRETAERLALLHGWSIVEDAGRGWRRVVPSPEPRAIVELEPIRHLVRQGYLTVTLGGGGIPVIRNQQGDLEGVEAVIDKDLSSSLLARRLGADMLILPTGVDRVALHFNTPDETWLDSMTVARARAYIRADEFAKGSMEPKVRALADFVEASGGTGIITSLDRMGDALRGRAGTRIVP